MAPQHPDGPDTPSYDPGQEPENTAQEQEGTAQEQEIAVHEQENAVQDGGEERAEERSAARAAAFAATEGFHPLRLRPYVATPGGEPGESTVRRLLHGDGEAEGPDAEALGLFPEASPGTPPGMSPEVYGGLEYPTGDEHFAYAADTADAGYAANAGEYTVLAGAGGLSHEEAAAYAAARRGRHRRRRRRIVVAAAAVAASALAAGAVAVTGQVMSDEQGASGQALPDLASTSVPDVTLPPDASPATAKAAGPVTQETARTTTPAHSSPSASAPASPAATATTLAAGSPATGTPASGTPQDPSAPPASSSPQPPGSPAATPAVQVLQLGDSGTAVMDLQRRLTEVWCYHGPIDGVFDKQVQKGVETFQVWYQVSDASDGRHDGVYGPNTRATLERQTSGF